MKYILEELIAFVNRANTIEELNIAENWIQTHISNGAVKCRLFEEIMTREKKIDMEGFRKAIEEDEIEMTLRRVYRY